MGTHDHSVAVMYRTVTVVTVFRAYLGTKLSANARREESTRGG